MYNFLFIIFFIKKYYISIITSIMGDIKTH